MPWRGPRPVANTALAPDVLQQVRQHSYGMGRGTELTRFALGCLKMLFTETERLQDSNVNGTNGKPPLSPTGRRVNIILDATAQEFGTSIDVIEAVVKKAIDASNRKLRYDNRRQTDQRTWILNEDF